MNLYLSLIKKGAILNIGILLTQACLELDCCILHNHFGAFIQFPLEDLLLGTEICRASTNPY